MAGIEIENIVGGKAKITGAKNETDVQVVTQALAELVKTYFGGTLDTHTGYVVQIKVRKLGV